MDERGGEEMSEEKKKANHECHCLGCVFARASFSDMIWAFGALIATFVLMFFLVGLCNTVTHF
jgi:hypothetical protein